MLTAPIVSGGYKGEYLVEKGEESTGRQKRILSTEKRKGSTQSQ